MERTKEEKDVTCEPTPEMAPSQERVGDEADGVQRDMKAAGDDHPAPEEKACVVVDPITLTKIQHQVEFYLSTSNLRRDQFLQKELQKGNGFVPISVLLKCNKLKALTTNPQAIVQAMKASNQLKLNENQDSIARTEPLPELDDSKTRMVIVGGLGRTAPSREELEHAMAPFGTITYSGFMHHRVKGERKFGGSAFIEYETKEMAIKAVENKTELKVCDRLVRVVTKEEYDAYSFLSKKRVDSGCAPVPTSYLIVENFPAGKTFREVRKLLSSCWSGNEKPFMSTTKDANENENGLSVVYLSFGALENAENVCKSLNEMKFDEGSTTVSARLMSQTEVDTIAALSTRPQNSQQILQITNLPVGTTRMQVINHLGDVWTTSTSKKWFDFHPGSTRGEFHIHGAEMSNAIVLHFEKSPLVLEGQTAVIKIISHEELMAQGVVFTKGLIVKFTDLINDLSRDELKDAINTALEAESAVAFVELNPEEAFVRFYEASSAEKLISKLAGKFELKDSIMKMEVLNGEEETAYWIKVQQIRRDRHGPNQKRKSFGGGKPNYRNTRRRQN